MIARGMRMAGEFAEGRGTEHVTVRSVWLSHLWPLILALPTVLLAAWVIVAWRFNGLYGQDPFAYYDFSVGPLRHSILDGARLTAMFWPLGYPILITLSSFVLGPVPVTGQIINVLADGATVCCTYLLGRDVLLLAGATPQRARRAGALGAVLLGMTGRIVESSVLIMADSVALATAALSAWALVRWCAAVEGKRPNTGWLALSATAFAWSMITRWPQALLLLAWITAALPLPRTHWRRMLTSWEVALALVPAAAVLGAQLWLVLTVRPDATVSTLPFAGDLVHVNGIGSSWSLAHLFQHRLVNADGVQQYAWPNGLFYAVGAFLPQYLTPIFVPTFILGLIVTIRMYRRALLLLLSWPAILLVFDAGLALQNPRYILAALPPIALFAGLGSAVVWDYLPLRQRPFGAVLMCAGLLTVAVMGLQGVGTLNRERNDDLQVAAWTAAHEPAGATTLTFGITLTLQHTTRLHALDLSVLSERELRRLVAARGPLYLLVQGGVMNGQVAARSTGINYRFLRDKRTSVRLGELHGYTLTRIAPR